MTIAELYDLLYTTRSMLDQILEFWLTASFAVLVASHFLADRLTRPIAALLAISYSVFSALLMTRFYVTGTKAFEIRERLVAAGETFSGGGSQLVGILSTVTFIVGFVAVLFVLRASLNAARDTPDP